MLYVKMKEIGPKGERPYSPLDSPMRINWEGKSLCERLMVPPVVFKCRRRPLSITSSGGKFKQKLLGNEMNQNII